MTDLELTLELTRKETIREIIYAFIVKSVVSRGRIPHKLE